MILNPDQTMQTQVIFSRKKNTTTHPSLFFNNSEIMFSSDQKHLGITLDSKLSFMGHIDNKIHQAKVSVNFENCKEFYHVPAYWLFVTSLLLPFVQIKIREKHPLACNFTKSSTPSWVFFTFLKLYKWYQIGNASHL